MDLTWFMFQRRALWCQRHVAFSDMEEVLHITLGFSTINQSLIPSYKPFIHFIMILASLSQVPSRRRRNTYVEGLPTDRLSRRVPHPFPVSAVEVPLDLGTQVCFSLASFISKRNMTYTIRTWAGSLGPSASN